jgi:hypothetical protein
LNKERKMGRVAATKVVLLALAWACLLAVSRFPHVVKAASFVVERSQMRVTGEGFAASFPSAIGDVSKKLTLSLYCA